MPQNTTIALSDEWQLLTDANVTEVTFQVIGSGQAFITGTAGTDAPAADVLGFSYQPGQGERNVALADLFLGVSGVNRLWGRGTPNANISINHA